ncbi:hypothetical protein NQ314_012686 [Rhamnusium bicolor]|uniref:Uncharacterized protein n=1 Tax=Rhamnusium bicolor TaxID=1586634 RepID=A0AAV8XAM4_9CUCU|nr:hypothetical protein NQ314_012686 [Rhamnusium bicolor]
MTKCVGIAHAKAMTLENIQAAFKKAGIFPYDRYVFTEIDFLPSKVTDRPDLTIEDSPSDQISSESSNVIEPESTVQQQSTKKIISPKEFRGFPNAKLIEKAGKKGRSFVSTDTLEMKLL